MRGIITKSISNLYNVETSYGAIYICNASSKLKMNKNQLVIGDIVEFEKREEKTGYIISIEDRKNIFVRPKVANVEYGLLVFSVVEPNMNWNLLDKFLISCENNLVQPLIIITKSDIANVDQLNYFNNKIQYYKKWYKVFYNNEDGLLKNLKGIIGNSIVFLMGQSGVGKSTFLNQIDENLKINTAQISTKLNRGKHTTRHTQLFQTNEMNIIDTPGFGMLNIDNLSTENVKSCFIDFFEMAKYCKFGARCNHISEKNCNIKERLLSGELLRTRYDSYIELFRLSKEKKW